MAKELLSPTNPEEISKKSSLPEELLKKWPIFAVATGVAATVAGLGFLLWKLRNSSGEKEQEKIDEIVENLPSPSKELDNLAVITLAQQAARDVRELAWKGEIGVLDLFIKACNELGVKSAGIKTLEDDIVAAASAAAVQEEFVHLSS